MADAIVRVGKGDPVILCDDDDAGEPACTLALAAQRANADSINFLMREAGGVVCLALSEERCAALALELQAPRALGARYRDFTVSIEARSGVTTGVSAADRARTIRCAIDPAAGPEAIVVPGHIFPVVAANGGVLERPRHPEAAVDLARVAGLSSASVICGIMREDGDMARVEDLGEFRRRHRLAAVRVKDIVDYRQRRADIGAGAFLTMPHKYTLRMAARSI